MEIKNLFEGHQQTYMIGKVSRQVQNKAKGTSIHDLEYLEFFSKIRDQFRVLLSQLP